MGASTEPRADSTLVDLYAAISVDDTRIFLAQNEIRSLEPAVDLNRTDPPVKGVGWISFDGRDWPVYCLGSDLSPSALLPATRRVCILLGVDQGYFGLMCDRLELLSANRLQPLHLPAIMRTLHTPVEALALYDSAPGCVVSADGLLCFLDYCAGLDNAQVKSGSPF